MVPHSNKPCSFHKKCNSYQQGGHLVVPTFINYSCPTLLVHSGHYPVTDTRHRLTSRNGYRRDVTTSCIDYKLQSWRCLLINSVHSLELCTVAIILSVVEDAWPMTLRDAAHVYSSDVTTSYVLAGPSIK